MTNEEALQYIHSMHTLGSHPGLDHTRALLAAIGNPQNAYRCLHVGGTNGKGSFCAMSDAILRAAGYRVGLYTSPYVKDFAERIRVNGENIPSEDLAEITALVRDAAEKLETPPAEFELITAIAFEYFRREKVDLVVLEVGLGGRLDPTNVIEQPLLSVITGIGFDHTALLGNTLQAIAAEKAGIIKPHCPALFGGGSDSAGRTLATVAGAVRAPFRVVDRSRLRVTRMTTDGTIFDFGDLHDLHLSLLGAYQPQNAATVLTAMEILSESAGMRIPEKAIRQGLESVVWHARFERLETDPQVFFDGAHNPQGIAAAAQSIRTYFPEEKVLILTGVMADKDYDGMIEGLKAVTARAYTVTPENPRALPAEDYAGHFHAHGIAATAYATVADALRAARADAKAEGLPLVCLGSLYLYQDVLKGLGIP